ncbi:chaperonin 10-like protein [Desarmillaria tabescens]|uniref:Chaperonin 10-like protein n=1 Tax=Armillaria tabescens TaxID=1929756 RepID=A0AA39NFJ5_ARMTA|nr:chaperonin 10-like protein [Desarmillaria tabescens]KAK0464703.1 chaperonin 10-like protein [Desarmillaria tabescens]
MSVASLQVAIRFHPPSYDIRVESVPIPEITHPDDAIVKIRFSGLCGSDLHAYRGHEAVDKIHTCGHEFIGEVIKLGSSFTAHAQRLPSLYAKLKIGNKVVCPFTTSCGECQMCRSGFTCRCIQSKLFGSPALEGAQAQYIRVPNAGGTLFNLSDPDTWPLSKPKQVSDSSLLLLADILPTGIFAAIQALSHPKVLPVLTATPWALHDKASDDISDLFPKENVPTFAIIGLGPVGVCATISLLDQLGKRQLPSGFRIVAVDPVESRRNKMRSIYSKISDSEVRPEAFMVRSIEEAKETVQAWTSGVGCSAVLEVVGNNSALTLAYELVQPFGTISSVGVHGERPFPLTGGQLYDKNVSFDFGRCPVRSLFPMAFDLLIKRQDVFGTVGDESGLIDRIVGFDEAVQMYAAFDKGEVGKIVFDPWKET